MSAKAASSPAALTTACADAALVGFVLLATTSPQSPAVQVDTSDGTLTFGALSAYVGPLLT
jgi:hypothetical protein